MSYNILTCPLHCFTLFTKIVISMTIILMYYRRRYEVRDASPHKPTTAPPIRCYWTTAFWYNIAMFYIYYSKFARDHYLGRYYIFRHGYHTRTKKWHIFEDMFISWMMQFRKLTFYFLNFIIQEINMSLNTYLFQFLCDIHAEKYNTALNRDP